MKTALIDYLVDMELDAGKAMAFRKDPTAAMAVAPSPIRRKERRSSSHMSRPPNRSLSISSNAS